MKPDEDDNLTGADLQAYKWGREGIADGLPWEDPSPANIKGQMDKFDADRSAEENDSDDENESDDED